MRGPYDRVIGDLIRNGDGQDLDRKIRNKGSWELFYQLSSLRRGVVCWYPFRKDWRCLEIGAGFGSLTGALLRSMKTVDAVEEDPDRAASLAERYRGEALTVCRRLPEGKRYDCIILTEGVTKDGDVGALLKAAGGLLSDDGVMLLGYRNRFAVKYLAGGIDETVDMPFGNHEKLFTRSEADELTAGAGFTERFYYYILPDVLFPQAVFSEKALPDSDSDRYFFFDAYSSPWLADPASLLRAALREGLFEKLADYFLVELRKKPSAEPRAVKAYMSCDRGRDHSFIVRFLDNGTVEKLPVYPEGQGPLEKMYLNLAELQARGVRTVLHERDGCCLRMPYVDKPSLLWYLETHPQETEAVFDRLYRDLLRSSECSAPGVLKKGYIDMIPFNCFYDDGDLVYYDQEFSEEDCPVAYIMFRAVLYTYQHLPRLGDWVPQERLKEKYGLNEVWEEYRAREDRFVGDNRNMSLYYQVWQWRNAEGQRQTENRELLLLGSSERYLLRRIHETQLKLLKELDRVCREYGLRYFLFSGLLLGAVRHGGFVPWMDEASVVMPRGDYRRFVRIAGTALRDPCVLRSPEPGREAVCSTYTRLGLKFPRERPGPLSEVEEACVDILPMDGPGGDRENRTRQTRKPRMQGGALCGRGPAGEISTEDAGACRSAGCRFLPGPVAEGRPRRGSGRKTVRVRGPETVSVPVLGGETEKREEYAASAFRRQLRLSFEDTALSVPAEYERLLIRRYGEKYMSLPSAAKQHRSRPKQD